MNVSLVAGGRELGAQLPRAGDKDRRATHRRAEDARHEGGRLSLPQPHDVGLGSKAKVPYIDVVVPAEQSFSGSRPQRSVAAAGGVGRERAVPAGGVELAGGVENERKDPVSGVVKAGGIEFERKGPVGGVAVADGVAQERAGPEGGVVAAGGVGRERGLSEGCVDAASGVALERVKTPGGIPM